MAGYQTKDSHGNIYKVSGQQKNLLLSIYSYLIRIGMDEEWEDFWQKEYGLKPMDEWSMNRKILWITEDAKWVYLDMREIDIDLPSEVVEKFLAIAIERVREDQTKKSKFLDELTARQARILFEVFSCFSFL